MAILDDDKKKTTTLGDSVENINLSTPPIISTTTPIGETTNVPEFQSTTTPIGETTNVPEFQSTTIPIGETVSSPRMTESTIGLPYLSGSGSYVDPNAPISTEGADPVKMKSEVKHTAPYMSVSGNIVDPTAPVPVEKGPAPVKAKKEVVERKKKDVEADDRIIKIQNYYDEAFERYQNLIAGDDELADTELNNLVTTLAPTNQATAEHLMLKMKQQGVTDGSMMSLLTSLALSQGRNFSQEVGKINKSSMDRINEMTKWGIKEYPRMLKMQQDLQKGEMQILSDKVKIGIDAGIEDPNYWSDVFAGTNLEGVDPDSIIETVKLNKASVLKQLSDSYMVQEDAVQTMAPGAFFDGQAWNNLGSEDQGFINATLQQIETLRDTGDPEDLEQAKVLLEGLAEKFPGVFGNPAQYADWDPNKFDPEGARDIRRRQNDLIDEDLAIDNMESAVDVARNMVNMDNYNDTLTTNLAMPDEHQLIMAIADLEGDPALWTDEERRDYMAADIVRDRQKLSSEPQQIFNAYFNNLTGEARVWASEPENEKMFVNLISEMVTHGAFEVDDEGNLRPADVAKMLPPMNPDSIIYYEYSDWPQGTFAEDGTFTAAYDGWNPEGSPENLEFKGDPAGEKYQDDLDAKYRKYLKGGGEKNANDWFLETQAGNKAVTPPPTKEEVPLPEVKEARDVGYAVAAGDGHLLTEDQIKLIAPTRSADMPYGQEEVTNWKNGTDKTNNLYKDLIHIGNLGLRVADGGTSNTFDAKGNNLKYSRMETADGYSLYFAENGRVYANTEGPLGSTALFIGDTDNMDMIDEALLKEYLIEVRSMGAFMEDSYSEWKYKRTGSGNNNIIILPDGSLPEVN